MSNNLLAINGKIMGMEPMTSSGSFPAFTKLWENPDPTAEFAAQTITLNSDDYDFLIPVHQLVANASVYGEYSWIGRKGVTIHCDFASSAGGNVTSNYRRLSYVDSTHYSKSGNTYAINGTESAVNTRNIPLAIYGFKKNIDISSLITNVSTSADQCMMSDEVTSVEDEIDGVKDALDKLTANNGAAGVDLSSYSTSSNKYTFPSDGYIVEAIGAQTSGKCIVLIYGANGASIANLCLNATFNYQCSSVFVRKGMSCYVYSRDSNVSVEFRGLT